MGTASEDRELAEALAQALEAADAIAGPAREEAEASAQQREHGRGVVAAIDRAIDACDPDARALLEGVAMFAPDLVPLAWALQAAGVLMYEGDAAAATATVKELGLVTLDEEVGVVSLHRLVHRQVRIRAERPERAEAWREVSQRGADAAARWIVGVVEMNPTRAEMDAVDSCLEHLDQALEAADRVSSPLTWITIANARARHLQNRVQITEARALFEGVLARAEKLDPPDGARVATSLSNLALALRDLGDAAGARPLLERALRSDEAISGPNHPTVAIRLSNLALVLRDLGDAAGARPLLERALRIEEPTFGPDHPTVAVSVSNLAAVLQDLGDAAGAKPLLERALRINETTFGPDHPSVGICRWSLALVLKALGDAAGARPLLERTIAIFEAQLPPGHPYLRTVRENLASLAADLPPTPSRP